MVGMSRIELPTYPLSGDCSTTELHANELVPLERIELPSEDYKAPVLPLYYSGVNGGQVRLRSTPLRMGFTDPLPEPLALPARIKLVSVGIEPTPDSE